MNTRAALGALLIAVSTVLIFALVAPNSGFTDLLGVVGALGMAVGSVLVGTSGDGSPV